MKKDKNKQADVPILRLRAEELLRAKKPENALPAKETDQKRLLHELQVHQIELEMQNEELLRTWNEYQTALNEYYDLYDFAPVGYVTLDREGVIRKTNLTSTVAMGIERNRLIGRSFSLFVKADMRSAFDAFLQKTFESDARQSHETMLLKQGGQQLWVRIVAKVPEPGQECHAAIIDITEAKHIEGTQLFLLEHLWSGEDFFKSLAQHLAEILNVDYVCIDRLEGDCLSASTVAVYFDGKFEDNVSYTLKDTPCGSVVGKTICFFPAGVSRLFPKDTVLQEMSAESYAGTTLWNSQGQPIGLIALISRKPMAKTHLVELILKLVALRAAGELERRQAEYELKKAYDQLEVRVQERTAELLDAYEMLREEIAERKQVEEQLLQSQKMEAMGTLAGGIAHDFNNILASILGFTEMSLDDVLPDNPIHRNLQFIMKSGIRGRELVKKILLFSRKAELKREPLRLSPMVAETLKLLRVTLPTSLKINTDLKAASDTVFANASEIQQIVMNLCTNAAHATQKMGGEMSITLTETEIEPGPTADASGLLPGEYVLFIVQDTGIGMAPEVIRRIFEPFFTTKETGKGTGLGLSMVYGIVKDLNGDIVVESEPGIGSTFRVYLPKMRMEPASEEPVAVTPGGKERILFVDDEEFLVELGKTMLGRLGYEVTAMTNSPEALKSFSDNPSQFDLVIADQSMPGITGINLAKELLQIRADIPVILCTGHSDSISTEEAAAAGIRQFLMKPLTKSELAQAIRSVLDERPEV